jgi:8-oxo-dGTP pyrophosphatase MutT (NUDIX family)
LTLRELERRLTDRLERRLPGVDAQKHMAPRPRVGWQPDVIPDDCRRGAGLLLLYPSTDGSARLVLTLRDGALPHHAGQVSLPGGAIERGETEARAALREAEEEIHVDASALRVLGRLSPLHIPVSEFVLHPVVAVADHRPDLRPHLGEVARILEVPLDHLLDRGRLAVDRRDYKGRTYEVPYFAVEGEKVWGATAMVLAEFLSVLDHPPDPWSEDEV